MLTGNVIDASDDGKRASVEYRGRRFQAIEAHWTKVTEVVEAMERVHAAQEALDEALDTNDEAKIEAARSQFAVAREELQRALDEAG
jgi:hypothetical protein